MSKELNNKASSGNIACLPNDYDTYVFDLYGTLLDIHTEENDPVLWEKLAFFYGYYDALYTGEELKAAYERLVGKKSGEMKESMLLLGKDNPRYAHEAFPELEITDVFLQLFKDKGVDASKELAVHAGQFFRVLSMDFVKYYPGTVEMLEDLRHKGKKVYLLSNAQRIFTEYELHALNLAKYFDDVLISSDYQTKKPDPRFYDALISKHNLDVKSCLFVGNDSTTDIAGAHKVGMDTFYVKSNISPMNDWAENACYKVDNFVAWGITKNE